MLLILDLLRQILTDFDGVGLILKLKGFSKSPSIFLFLIKKMDLKKIFVSKMTENFQKKKS